MKPSTLALQRRLAALDAHLWAGLGLRLGLTIWMFQVWTLHVVRSPFRLEDVDPALRQLAQDAAVDLLDATLWPTATGVLARIGLLLAVLGIGAWGLGRLRWFLQRRWGPGLFLGLAVGLAWWIGMLGAHGLLGHLLQDLTAGLQTFDRSSPVTFAVWGGFVEWRCLPQNPEMLLLRWAFLILALEAGLMHVTQRLALWEVQEGALRARLAPHFVFNAFSTLASQIEWAPGHAALTARRMASLFRRVLGHTEQAQVPLHEEWSLVEDLLALEKDRLGERLQVDMDLPDALREVPVPTLALQVLVENALRHGVEPRTQGGLVRIEAKTEGRWVVVSVTDPGDGSGAAGGAGKALDLLRQRLASPRHLEMGHVPEGYCVAFRVKGVARG